MNREKSILSKGFADNRSNLEKMWNSNKIKDCKSSQASEEYRKQGNQLFTQSKHSDQQHKEIFIQYNKSITHAPVPSEELAYAYGNRAALFLHLHKYEDCIKDCNRALNISSCYFFKCKLLCRKAECLKRLGLEGSEAVLIKAKKLSDKISDCQIKNNVVVLIDKVKLITVKNIQINKVDHKPIILPITSKCFDQVRIEYNQKYGRHLVANKNYEPGDVIITEKLYAHAVVGKNNSYMYCHYCLKALWSGVPCDCCNWVMFCSEDCQQEAWTEFHSIECALMPFLREVDLAWNTFFMNTRILLLSLKKFGGIGKLKAALEVIDKCTDVSKGFSAYEKFDGIQSLYSLSSAFFSNEFLCFESQAVAKMLIGLAKHTKLLDNSNLQSFNDFLVNDDVIFLGSLLVKISLVTSNNSFTITHWINNFENLTENPLKETSSDDYGLGLALLASLFNHSCCANASIYITEDNKISIFAFCPIKKNSQIFINYCDNFQVSSKKERHAYLEKYCFECECDACIENWPAIALLPFDQQMKTYLNSNNTQIWDLFDIWKNLYDVLKSNKDSYLKKKDLDKLKKAISQGYKLTKEPSFLMCILTDLLHRTLSQMYCAKLQTFSPCDRA